MRPKERRESGQNDLFRARFDQIVDMGPLAGEARPRDRLAVSRDAIWGGLFRQGRKLRLKEGYFPVPPADAPQDVRTSMVTCSNASASPSDC
jgi:hypothetical protein